MVTVLKHRTHRTGNGAGNGAATSVGWKQLKGMFFFPRLERLQLFRGCRATRAPRSEPREATMKRKVKKGLLPSGWEALFRSVR